MLLSEVKANPDNPRVIRDERFEKLCKSIKEFPKMMSLRPIVVDDNNMVLGGNMRLRALQVLKFKEIPDEWVKMASELTEEEKKRFIIADNVNFGEHDFQALEDWDREELIDWGVELEENEENEKAEIKTIEIVGFKKTHVLLSFAPETMLYIQDYLQKIKDTIGVEYEQASN